MTISGVGSAYSYGNYSTKVDAASKDTGLSQVNQTVPSETAAFVSEGEQKESESPKAPKSGNLENFVFDFKKDNEYNLVGAKSKLEDLDVEQAISDMKKDSVLDQYKFFVKSSLVNDEDGSVRQVVRN